MRLIPQRDLGWCQDRTICKLAKHVTTLWRHAKTSENQAKAKHF